MKWIALSLGGVLLLIGAAVLFGRSEESAPPDSTAAVGSESESVTQVLSAQPNPLDFQSLATATLDLVKQSEVERYSADWIEPLRAWGEPAERMAGSLEASTSEWCAPYQAIVASADDGSVAFAIETREEERGVVQAGSALRLEAAYGAWNDWLIRLAEAQLSKSERTSVENFQEDFGELTDEFETALSEAVAFWYRAFDQSYFSTPSLAHWPGAVALGLASSSIDTRRVCAGEMELSEGERGRLLTQVKQWETKRSAALRQNEARLSRMTATEVSLGTALSSAVRELEAKLQETVGELQASLAEPSS